MRIKTGDLVIVARPSPCCGNENSLGRAFVVGRVWLGTGCCHYCKESGRGMITDLSNEGSVLLSRVEKIEPLADGEGITKIEELEAT